MQHLVVNLCIKLNYFFLYPIDRPPIFTKRDNVYCIRENTPVGRIITQLEATTTEEDTELKYKLASADYVNEELFQIDQAGRVLISGKIIINRGFTVKPRK